MKIFSTIFIFIIFQFYSIDFVLAKDAQNKKYVQKIITEAQAGSGSAAYSLAQIYIEKENYKKAEEWLRFSIFKGEGKSSLALYELAQAGHIELENANEIKQIGLLRLREEAQAGSGAAAINLADMYLKGEYVAKDYKKAQEWFYIAEQDGKPRASYMLGLSYLNGLYNNISIRKAIKYFEKASNGGVAMASRQLGIAYASGIGKEKDLAQSKEYFEKASRQGSILAMRDLALMHKQSGDIEEYVVWLKKAAENGDADSYFYLGQHYKGKNSDLSTQYFTLAAQQKHHLSRIEIDKAY